MKRSVNFIYAVFFITLISATCTFFIVRTTNAVTEEIDDNRALQNELLGLPS